MSESANTSTCVDDQSSTKKLRQPHSTGAYNTDHPHSSLSLSVDAPEFTPRNSNNANTPIKTQEPTPLPRPPELITQAPLTEQYRSPAQDCNNSDVMANVEDILRVMSANPGCFDDRIQHLVAALNAVPLDKDMLDNLTNLIYEQSISDTNFTYTGAKVCDCLAKNLVVQKDLLSFRSTLMSKLQVEYKNTDAALLDPLLTQRVYRYTMFMAELFLNMEIMEKENSKPTKVKTLRKPLHGLMLFLLNTHKNEDTLFLIQLLKLTGAQLEDFDREQIPSSQQLQDIIDRIKDCILDDNLERKTRKMLLNLIEQRASNWGRDTSSPTAQQIFSNLASGDSTASGIDPNAPIYYSPADGKVISKEESSQFQVDENDYNNMEECLNTWSLGTNNHQQFYDEFYNADGSGVDREQGFGYLNEEEAEAFDEFQRSYMNS